MTKQEKKDVIEKLLKEMKLMLFEGIDNMPDNDYHPVELILSSANTLYLYASLVQQGLSDDEIKDIMKDMANQIQAPEENAQKVIDLPGKAKKKNETIH